MRTALDRFGWVVAIGIATSILGCTPPVSPDEDGDGWTVDGTDSDGDTNPDEDTEPPGDVPPGALTVDLGKVVSSGSTFEPYPGSGDAEFEIVRGFQGGFHIEPAVLLTGVRQNRFTARLNYVIERTSNGERVSRPSEFRIGPRGWTEMSGGHVHRGDRVIFDVAQPSDIEGDEVELRMTANVQSGGSDSKTIVGTVVDNQR